MRIDIHQTPDELGMALAGEIFDRLFEAQLAGRQYLLGCPSGRSPRPVYRALASLIAGSGVDLSHLVLVMMDDYLENDSAPFRYVDKDKHYSCRRFAELEVAGLLNGNRPEPRHLPRENIWFPDPNDGAAYDRRIAAAGGIDLFLLASGASDGHVGFNPPASPRDGLSYVAKLADLTRRDNLQTFPAFQDLSQVPRYGVTVGIGTIADQAKSAAMILCGEAKRRAFEIISRATCYDPAWPATIIAECNNPVLYADLAAAQAGPR
jgi:glucosamine-6-phosphate deaminase